MNFARMSRRIRLFVLLALFLTCPAFASYSRAWATFSNLRVNGDLTPLSSGSHTPYSYSDVAMDDGMGNSPSQFDPDVTDTHAKVTLTPGWAEAATSLTGGSTESGVASPYLKEVYARAEACRSLWFVANRAGDVTVLLDYLCGLDLAADADGGRADGQASILAVWTSSSPLLDKEKEAELWYSVEDGDTLSIAEPGTLWLSATLAGGQMFRLDLYALSDSTAYSTIPAPGAAILGLIGAATLGVVRRQRLGWL